ncbi:hypothetical protein [Tenacibaculum aiptasiae]|uniref:hypothetical protein n=1 Tax=Tenacibaculum aiptasiae TaxID=426481 RepID=UPI00232BBE97|nr:hypothetical protein [Tenacibaculum aiptasiae]
MKKVLLLAMLNVFFITSCTDSVEENLQNETQFKQTNPEKAIDPEKECPPNDRNCNGVPDDQE